ncbi:hypothetical protein Dsin_028524 [Dipteronia sinensis]|uniref:Reverse transcriptase domain-containing protein n=1 Tax=Dipteronia sinensis TaxID=43782 RepID=A0AAE0DUC6_9ROSI|nr:hypothetical protein Dsin_028524 [Dipteronia sinensis]
MSRGKTSSHPKTLLSHYAETANLIRVPSFDEIHDAVFSMDAISALRHDGYTDLLALVAARIVSPQLFGFIRDRHIKDCIALASDCVNVLHKSCCEGNLAMRIDIRKAFDTLDWSFISRVLQTFGFCIILWIGLTTF